MILTLQTKLDLNIFYQKSVAKYIHTSVVRVHLK